MKLKLSIIVGLMLPLLVNGQNIVFQDNTVKKICVENWDTDGDGELSLSEAAAVTDIGTTFKNNTAIKYFEELRYFTGLTSLFNDTFNGCTALRTLYIPSSVTAIGRRVCANCKKLSNIYYEYDHPHAINTDNFPSTVFTNAKLHIPAKGMERFSKLSGWKNFNHYATFEDSIVCEEVQSMVGSYADMTIGISTSTGSVYNGFQFDIFLPAGATIAREGTSYVYSFSELLEGKMQAAINKLGSTQYRVMVYSLDNATFTTTESELITFSIYTDGTMTDNLYNCELKDFRLSRVDGKGEYLPDLDVPFIVGCYPMGDVNHDFSVNISDVMLAVDNVLGIFHTGYYEEQADMNHDGTITVTDVMSIVDIILHSDTSYAPAIGKEF